MTVALKQKVGFLPNGGQGGGGDCSMARFYGWCRLVLHFMPRFRVALRLAGARDFLRREGQLLYCFVLLKGEVGRNVMP